MPRKLTISGGAGARLREGKAAIRILYEVYPQTRPTGKDEATAVRDDVKVLQERIVHWKLHKAGGAK